jgi:hypothetical protein
MRRASGIFSVSLAPLVSVAPAAYAQTQPSFETTRVAEGVYQFRWQAHNALFVTTPPAS